RHLHRIDQSFVGAEVQVVHKGVIGPSPPDLVPFWKPPNISDKMISTTITSSTSIRHPPVRDCGQRRRGPLDLYIRMCMPRHSAICRPRRIICTGPGSSVTREAP